MASTMIRRVLALILILATISEINSQGQGVPPVKFQVFKPKGFRAYIDHVLNLAQFIFHGNVNKPISTGEPGSVTGEIHSSINKKWIFEDLELELKVGDVINYYVFVTYETDGFKDYYLNYMKDNLRFTVTEIEDLSSLTNETQAIDEKCAPTLSKKYGSRKICSGEVLFEENFASLRDNFWKIEHSIPINHDESPFVSYQRLRSNPTVTVENGNLRIAPVLQQNVPGYNEESITSGTINLINGCTSEAEACYKEAVGPDILPPIVSGRVTSKGFAFRYGTVYVRAKLPLGHWLYPEILLEPFQKNRYGRSRYASGVLKIACARGNDDLNTTSLLYGNRVLYGGPIIDFSCSRKLLNHKLLPRGSRWGDEFHVYALRWTPDDITLLVDGKQWARVAPKPQGLVGWLPKECKHAHREVLGYHYRPKIAPFDDFFYISLGVAAGGITEFPDGSHTDGGLPKPWTNTGRKAMLNFWQDLPNWISTWNEPELLVDYIKVVAL